MTPQPQPDQLWRGSKREPGTWKEACRYAAGLRRQKEDEVTKMEDRLDKERRKINGLGMAEGSGELIRCGESMGQG